MEMNDNFNNEPTLLLSVASGDQQAFRVLFDRYWDRVYANALQFTKSPETARDLAQEIFLKIWLQREKLTEVKHFAAYLFTLSRNMILDELRRLHNTPATADFLDAFFAAADPAPDGLEKTALKDLEQQLNAAIDQLPAQMQTAFRLSRFEGLTHEQIARQMQIGKVTSQNYIARALLSIRKYLANQQIELSILFLLFLKK
jgi:RNA polymerase sigma-70 factor (family 1)